MRIRGLDEETEEQLEDYEELKGKIADLTKTADKPGGISLFTDETKQTYKSTYQLLKEISEIYNDLTDKQQAGLLEALAGKRGGQVLAGVLSDFSSVEKAMETMENAAGSADKEMDIIKSSISYKINELKETWTGVLQDAVKRGTITKFIDALTKISDGFASVVKNAGLFKTAIISIATVIGSKKLGLFDFNAKDGILGTTGLGGIIRSISNRKQNKDEVIESVVSIGEKYHTASEQADALKGTMGKLNGVGVKLAGVFKSLGGVLLNAFASAALSWGITKLGEGLKWVYDNWLTDNAKIEKELKKIEKANKNLEKSISDLTESESELSNVESEISRINDEISSIQNKGKLELTDEGDIDRLSRQNSLLQTQKRILENNIKLQKDSMAFSAKNVLDTGYTGRTYEVSDKSTVVSTGDENYSYKDWAKYYENAFITQSYNGYLKALSSGDDAEQKLYKEAVDKNSAEITQYISSLYEILQSFQDSEGNIISGYEDLYEEYTEMISNLQSLIDPNSFNQFLMDWSKDEKLNYNFEEGFNDVLEDMYGMEDFDFNKLRSMNEEFFDKLAEQGISDSTISAILNYKKSIYESVLQTINDTYNVKDIPELKTSYLDNPNETGTHLRTEDGAKVYTGVETELDRERQKLIDWGLEQYEDQIDSGILHIFGNVDMDKRAIITWSEELKETYKNELASWNYDPEIGSIDTVFGGYDEFGWGGKQHEIAFTPILQTEDGKAVLLSSDEVFKYIESVIDKAGEDGVITADEILKIDATETGKQFGQQFGKGLIAGIDESEGMTAEEVGKLMHFSGKYGAWNLAKYPTNVDYGQSDEMKKFQEATDQAKSSYDSLTEYVKNHPMETGLENLPVQYKHLKDLMGDNWSDDLLNKFTPEERQLALKIEITDEGYDYDSLKKKLETKISPIEVEVKPKASDMNDSMAEFKTAANSLDDLYSQTVLKEAKEGLATGFADPSLINNVESNFGQFVDDTEETQVLNAALERFEKDLLEMPNDTGVAQDSMNHLLTAYIDQTKMIDELDESTRKWTEAQIENAGVSNAAQVVYSRLSEKSKKTSANLKALSKVIKDNRTALNQAVAAGDKSAKVYDTIATSVKDLLTVYDDEGNAQLIPDIDAQFVIDNFEDIENAIAGDMDAIARLRVEASKGAMLNVGVYDDAFWSDANAIAVAVSQLNDSDFTIDGYMNNSDIIAKLNAVRANFQGTAQEFAAWISQITGGSLTAEIDYDVIPVSNLAGKSGYEVGKMMGLDSHALTAFSKDWDVGNVSGGIRIPKVVNYKWNGSSLGSNTNYGGGGGGSSSGGGGGGGGSEPTQPKEESEEMFDWVEVAIQRIEEEISRLDKVVGNTYETWGERNEARIKEIKELEKEYKALGIASSEYFRNAEKVQVNGGKGLNDDDYGENDELVKENDQRLLDEAKAAWATGEYKKKVQQGLLTGDDIEKIANHFLSDTIKEYQEIYQKGVDAQDKEYDKLIELGNQYKGAFDDVKEEYSELIQYITDQADVIDERINRTEKHGYFVSKSYYEDLKALEAQRYSKLDAEYEDLIKKRDEAVASGTIKEGSEAWHQMNQEINGVNLELEKSKTQMVEYNNTIRQLDWD